MFPLTQKKLIRGAQAHINAGLGAGADYVANYDTLYAPFTGVLRAFYGKQGGKWLSLTRENGDKIQFAHLSQYIRKGGDVQEGAQIAITGNTGTITTGPHLHVQIFQDGKRLDPEEYDWKGVDDDMYKEKYEQEVADHKESIAEKEENYRKWQEEIDKRKTCENKIDAIKEIV